MSNILYVIASSVLVAILYLFAANAVKSRWKHKFVINPLKITAESTGRASLSKAQVLFFTLIVLWISIYWVMKTGELTPINTSILSLLGVAVAGSGVGRVAKNVRSRVTGENWAWAKKKGWIKNDFSRTSPEHVPKVSDLITSDGRFQIARFQAVAFSLVVGFSLLYAGVTEATSLATVSIDDSYLILIGLSQGVYVGGKFVGADPIAELNTLLDKLRKLELNFTKAVAKVDGWDSDVERSSLMQVASEIATNEYAAYMSEAMLAAVLVESLTGNNIEEASIRPGLPPYEQV